GQKLLSAIGDDVPTTPAERWTVAGKPTPKVDGREFVTGRHRYASDQARPGMLHGKVLRPPTLGATLARLDSSGAGAIPGVVVVRDGAFAGVAAPDELTAGRALGALRAEWTEEPPPGSDRDVYERLKRTAARGGAGRGGPGRGDRGSLDQGMAAADV